MASKDSKPTFVGEKFGQKRPPLSITIKQILERYPDGQIFKEMIQNADDAGAKKVQFFVDSRSFGKESLAHPGLAPFQGPALLAVNDATFSEKDWEGIERLQQSIKADDPFKVGRFGIGFNSVYHLTDVPVIISGVKVAYMEPQERIWPDQSGRSFTISELQNTDSLIPFHNISDFKSSGMAKYSKTIFRFPLRTEPSELSEGLYDVQKVHKLINALRAEAKLLIVFLRSVDAIEVYDIARDGSQTVCFKTEISEKYKSSIGRKRKRLIDKLREVHSQRPYNISAIIGFTAEFTIKVSGVNLEETQSGEFRWLVSNQVGSENKNVLEAAEKQKVFPWVGTAIELNEDSRNGRIFCFLPMPIETNSNLPVHVNGTFGMTDDRRSLKWPGVERENDSTADWNEMLVKYVLPQCYVTLLLEAKNYLSADQFYKVWPCQASLRKKTWGELLEPLYTTLLACPVFWSKVPKKEGEWIEAKHGCFVKKGTTLDTVIQQSLVSCGVNVVCIPQNVWDALQLAKVDVKQIGPKFVRTKLKDHHRYVSLERKDKFVILEYCMSDNQYFDLIDLFLLPLSNGKFAKFQKETKGVSKAYVSSTAYPSYLLPNLLHLLVDISVENLSLHEKLLKLAESKNTHVNVRPLTESTVAELLEQSMPTSWKSAELVSLPHPEFPSDWFGKFWNWAGAKKLKTFSGKLVLPVASPLDHQSTAEFYVVKMTSSQAVIYVPSGLDCSREFQKSLDKLKVFVCCQDDFPFVFHKHLKTYVKPYDTNGLLDAIAATANYSQVQLTDDEAETLRNFIKPSDLNNQKRADIAAKLRMFKTAENTHGSLYSIDQVRSNSTLKKPIAAPTKSCLDLSSLPPSMLMFSQFDPSQVQLLQKLKVAFPSDCEFILNHLIPMMRTKSIPDVLVDQFMVHILDAYYALVHEDSTIVGELRTLAFVRTSTSAGNRKAPSELFDPRNHDIHLIFQKEESRFPISPYNSEKYLDVMKEFGLRTVVSSDEILGVIKSIGSPPSQTPQRVDHTRLTCATTILHYVCKSEFLTQLLDAQQFFMELKYLSETKSWIPVLATPPSSLKYPSDSLKWRGSGFDSHLMSLQDKPCFVLSTENCEEVPLLVGSQMYLTNPSISPSVATKLQQSTLSQYIVPHLEEVIACSNKLAVQCILHLLHPIYRQLENTCPNELQHLGCLTEWLYIREWKRFVNPAVVAIRKNPDFRHDLEPYIYLLPETLQEYKELFCNFGMHEEISQDQILSVLEKMRNEISSEKLSVTSVEASRLIMSILNWLTENGNRDISDLVQNSDVYIPTDVESDWPKLENAKEVIYSDSDFLKEYASSESETTLMFSHSSIHQKMAECLGLKLLSEELDISEDAFEDSGQHESLTDRLATILKDYKDGLTIAKELLQNADDAEATEFNICYDSRQHSVRKERLFFQGMLQSHGPALIFHNNKTFSDDDFVNITRLAGATKEKKQLKIGKFGIGFCSVYHITDIPSFVSRDQLHILDPTLTCLAKEVKNPSKPGKKVKFTMKMISRSDQLQPYVGLFGFDKTKSYDGTLFRLPFRFQSSDLSTNFYDESKVNILITELQSCASKLLLFLQHVNRITFQRIDSNQLKPTVLFEITKSQLSIPASLPPLVKCYSISLVKESTKASENWLIAHNKTTLEHCNTTNYATSSVACLLSYSSSTYRVMPIEGEIFCYLPLSQKTGLPVHVSANFAVISNRRGIWTSDEVKDKVDSEVVWNQNIMKRVVPKTYCNLLLALQKMSSQNLLVNYTFHVLWPLPAMLKIKHPWEDLLPALYDLIADNKLFLTTTTQWVKLAMCKVLATGILKQTSDCGTPKCVMDVLTHLNQPLVQLPERYHNHFQLNDSLITERAFIKLFFKNLTAFSKMWRSRNEVIQCVLEIYATEYDDGTDRSYFLDELLNSHACIPTTPNGTKLRKCNELIDPDSKFAELYDKDDGRFPDELIASRKSCQLALQALGMLCDDIPWEMVVDRARSISATSDTNRLKALHRVRLVLECIDPKRGAKFQAPSDLLSCNFLPVAPRPDNYPSALTWKGEGIKFSCGNKLTLSGRIDKHSDGHAALAGSQNLFLCENSPEKGGCGIVNYNLCQLLQIKSYPTVSEVICQLKNLVRFSANIDTVTIDKTCNQIYSFLNKEIKHAYEFKKKVPDLTEVRKIPCIWTGNDFITTACVAANWKVNGPYLYAVPSNLISQDGLCKELHIKHDFSEHEITSTLQKMSEKFKNTPIDPEYEELFKEMIPLLHKIKPKKFSNFKILLPDEKMVLRWSTDLAYNDAEWAPNDGTSIYVNDIIPSKLAKQLHIKAISSEVLEKFTVKEKSFFAGSEFGQREDLTQRIQNILRDYPFNNTVLKELLQNADDAKASKMFVILDKRFHNTKKVLSEYWGKLQGPALLVWNDRTFSDSDLKGIQRLGLGSKRKDHESIGQYGIGFNVVYHLTDCPSFVTDNNTLCVLDPHCHFVPGATPKSPGRMFSGGEFWETYPDIKPAYLRDLTHSSLSEISGGSLFRFPLRYTAELVSMSEIIQKEDITDPIITADVMYDYLSLWAPQLKNAMFFLNHITELKFYVIEENSSVSIMHHYKTHVDSASQKYRETLAKKVSQFSNTDGNESYLIHYLLYLKDLSPDNKVEEKWIIQQGVGDINNKNHEWQFVKQVKPKHGIALPFSGDRNEFNGQLFCFLPLPIITNLPVHVNGNFILNSTRLNLWSTPNRDDKTRWNDSLIEAIGSSYEHFLVNLKPYFFTQQAYEVWPPLLHAIHDYYSCFPDVSNLSMDTKWQALCSDIYAKVVDHNDAVLVVVESNRVKQIPVHSTSSTKKLFRLQWHCVTTDISSVQVYFWKSREGFREHDQKVIRPILERIGMKISSAPLSLMTHLNQHLEASKRHAATMTSTSPNTVYLYYIQHCTQCSSTRTFPCAIDDTAFVSVADFKEFTQYTLSESLNYRNTQFAFFKPPFNYPLLLTQDRKLRCFEESNKVLRSQFAETFPQCQHLFLHRQLLEISYNSSYFVDASTGLKVILEIFKRSFPVALFSERKYNNENHSVTMEKLKMTWECLANDSMFNNHISAVIKSCAIIPAKNSWLYKSVDTCLQPMLLGQNSHEDTIRTVQVLQSIGMPFVDTGVVKNVEINCPELSQSSKVLKNLYYLFQENDFTSLMNETRVKVLVDLIKEVNMSNSTNRMHAMSLPLFQTVDNKFVSIYEKSVYLWPSDSSMCNIAYSKWAQYSNAVFLSKPSGTWLYYPVYFEIHSISAEDLYTKFVFPRFSSFTSEERHSHLKHIRDKLYRDNKHYVETKIGIYNTAPKYKSAKEFIAELKVLNCLEKDDGTLARVNEFCDHKQTIFKTFAKKFQFLPQAYRTDDDDDNAVWMNFFKDLGLKETVSKEEYLSFCLDVSRGAHKTLSEASITLVKHLLSEAAGKESWCNDTTFLSKVSNIAFVLVEKVDSLNWAARHAPPTATFVLGNSSRVELASPSQSAVLDCSSLLWTVKPLVDLYLPLLPTVQSRALLRGLNVTENATVNTSDIIANITNISRLSNLADFSLFDTYPECLKPPDDVKGLMEIMLDIFQHLFNVHAQSTEIDSLSSLACVPVYSMPQITTKWQLVLVKPCYVLTCEVDKFHPYLHKLPDELMSVFPLLMKVGVKTAIDLTHVQVVLKRVYDEADNEKLEANTNACVIHSLKHLKDLLHDSKKVKSTERSTEEALAPLYLPGVDGKLHLSTKLMYGDTSDYRGHMKLDLQETGYAQLHIRPSDYSFTASDLCNVIPENIRPKKMSELCDQKIVSSQEEVSDTLVTRKIKQTLKVNLLSRAALRIIAHHTKDDSIEEKMRPIIDGFVSNIQVFTVRNLKMTIKLKETGTMIGNVSTDFHLQCEEHNYCRLFLDSKIDVPSDDHVINKIADHILSQVAREHPQTAPEILREIRKNLVFLFKVQNDTQIEKMLYKEGIVIESDDMNFPIPELGKEIPSCWHHRLDQDSSNIFYPMEWVGYEDHENHFIFVQVCYPKLPNEHSDWDSVPRLEMKYLIHVNREDLDGVEVSGLDLYKFIKGKLKSKMDPSQPTEDLSLALEVYEGAPGGAKREYDEAYLKALKEKIRQELLDIMKLPDEQRKKAVKRLYLKWHPDKNPDNPELAEEVFKFIQSELERLKSGKSSGSGQSAKSWFYDFSSWDDTARDHSYFFKREHRSYSSKSSNHFSSSGGSFFYDSYSTNEDRNIKEGWRWIHQAEVDAGMMRINNAKAQEDPGLNGYGLVCFLSHQVSEKALQGGVYAVCGKYERDVTDHSLTRRAYMIQARKLGQTLGLLSHISPLERYYLDTRYPNRHPSDIPANHFTSQEANEAVDHAEFVLNMVKSFMPDHV